jgi:hypothetical protein
MKAHNPEHKPKFNNTLLGIASIFAIFLIVYFSVMYGRTDSVLKTESVQGVDSAGQVSVALSDMLPAQDISMCKLIVGQTTLYDDTTLAVSLESGSSTYYAGYSVSVFSINDNGCVVDVNGNADYLAVGQIQRLGSLYVTVKDIVK